MNYIAINYAQPLISFLQNSTTSLSDNVVQQWLVTLTDLDRFARNEPNNQVALLNDLVAVKLTALTNANCQDGKLNDGQTTNNSWFATRRIQIERQVNVHCQNADEKAVITQYMAIAKTFNRDIAGRFPFAPIDVQKQKILSPKVLRRFLLNYRKNSNGLLTALNKLEQQQPGSIPDSWTDFISQMNNISYFFKRNWLKNQRQWRFSLNVEFDALATQAIGSNQIIEWKLNSGDTQMIFPQGDNTFEEFKWKVGQPLSLALRWAKGSAFVPLASPSQFKGPLQVDSQHLTATYSNKSQWALFEWLARYAHQATDIGQEDRLLSFHTPVVVKGQGAQLGDPAYISRANLLIWATAINDGGEIEKLSIPVLMPAYAPQFND